MSKPTSYRRGPSVASRILNRQALAWCRDIANQKPKRVLGMSPEAAYLIEKPYLQPLPNVLPPVCEVLERVVDLYGYARAPLGKC
jgi:hypothetical protein